MNREERKAAWIKTRAESYEGSLRNHIVKTPEKKPAPEPPPLPPRTLTDAEITRMIADAVAKFPCAPTSDEIKRMIADALAAYHDNRPVTLEAIAPVLHELRQQLRAEIAKVQTNRPAEEFFYLDNDGEKKDAELHARIINPVDFPIDEKIMKPIRDRNRAKWLTEEKQRKAARVIDMRGRRA